MDCGKGEIAEVDANGTGVRVLTHDKVTETSPAWSPNHEPIAFIRATAHAVGRATGLGLAWSPGSKQLVFNGGGKLELVNTAGTHYHSLGVDGDQPSWSPDGQWIVFPSGDYVKEIRPDGQGIRHILYVTSKKGRNFEPNW